MRIARKHVAWYIKGQRGAVQFKERFNRAETPQEQNELIEELYDELLPREGKVA